MVESSRSSRLDLEDILGDVRGARRTRDFGRLALLAFCELRRWARFTRREELAAHANALFLGASQIDRERFLVEVDALIAEAEDTLQGLAASDESRKCSTASHREHAAGTGDDARGTRIA
jgi:hypothetical protein